MSDKLDFAELKASGLLPSPKGVALTIMQLCQKENFSLPELAHAIQADPVLAGRVIKIANAANPNKSRPIAAVTIDTLILIGIHAVRQVVLSFSLINSYQEGNCKAFDFQHYWSRSVAMASAAQAIGGLLRVAPPAEMFTCGLLSGIGRLGIASARPEAYSDVLSQLPKDGDLKNAEQNRFGLDHSALGALMLEDWGIPKLFIDAVVFHENPSSSGFSESSRQSKLIHTLHLAALLADACLQDESRRDELMAEIFEGGSSLGLKNEQMVDVANRVSAEWQEWGQLLNIQTESKTPFQLPEPLVAAAPAAKLEADETAVLPPASHPLRILFADADDALTFSIEKLLASAGHKVLTARNGRQAFDIAEREKPHVIIADWLMPESDGLAFCRAVREQPWGAGIYFLVLTALEDDRHQIEAFEAGTDDYLKKPFNPRLLQAKLLVAQRRLQQSA